MVVPTMADVWKPPKTSGTPNTFRKPDNCVNTLTYPGYALTFFKHIVKILNIFLTLKGFLSWQNDDMELKNREPIANLISFKKSCILLSHLQQKNTMMSYGTCYFWFIVVPRLYFCNSVIKNDIIGHMKQPDVFVNLSSFFLNFGHLPTLWYHHD